MQSLTLSLPERQLNQRCAWTKAPFIAAQKSSPLSDLQSRVSGPLFSAQSVDLREPDLIDALVNRHGFSAVFIRAAPPAGAQ